MAMGRIDTVRDAGRRFAWWAATPSGLAWLFLAGAVIRLWLARGGGFPYDMQSFAGWADRLATRGVGDFYPRGGEEFFVDYPPGYLYVLALLGEFSHLLGRGAPSVFLIKLPAVLADLGLAALAVRLSGRLTPPSLGRVMPWRGLVAAAILLNPAIFFVSAVWGQVDAILALLVLGCFILLGTGTPTFRREAGGIALLAVAVTTKPQAIFVFPIVLLLLAWRHVRGAAVSSGSSASSVLAGVGRVAGLGLVGLAVVLGVVAPFGLGLSLQASPPFLGGSLVEFYQEATRTYEATSVFAFNFWGAVGFWRPDLSVGDSGQSVVRVLGIPAFWAGMTLFVAATIGVLVRAWVSLRRGELEGRVLVFGGAAVTFVAFALLTRIHERYLFMALVLLVPLFAYRALRWSMLALSALYLVNVYFPYHYYVSGFEGRTAFKIPLFGLLYGGTVRVPVLGWTATIGGPDGGIASIQLRVLSVLTALVCLGVAYAGWRWLEARSGAATEVREPPPAPVALRARAEREPRPPWTLHLHAVGRRGAAAAAVAFVLAATLRLVGLGTPHGMYFDEVYHARTAGEYLQGKEVYEWTHPPLAKELMALSITGLSGFGSEGTGPVPEGFAPSAVGSGGERVAWAVPRAERAGALRFGVFSSGCGIEAADASVPIGVRPTSIDAEGDAVVVGGRGEEGPVLARVEGRRELWRVPIGGLPVQVLVAGGSSFAVDDNRTLWAVGLDGSGAQALAGEVGSIDAAPGDDVVWATFPGDRRVASFRVGGATGAAVTTSGEPTALVVPEGAGRVVVATAAGGVDIVDADVQPPVLSSTLAGVAATRLGAVPGSGLAWAVDGRDVSVIEPRGGSVIGHARFADEPSVLLGDAEHRRLVGVAGNETVCVGGRPALAWRIGSAVLGGAMAALALLIALRLFGSVLAGGLAALFVAVDGLAYTLSRIAMNDSYVTAFLLCAWFCILSVLFRWGEDEADRSRWPAIGWLAGAGVFAGVAMASKWVGAWGLLGIAVVVLWDVLRRRREGLLSLAGGPVRTVALSLLLLGAVPIGIYVASYIPYFALGHSFGELIELQRSMYGYHANLEASHPYSSPWFGWPVGRNPVYLFLDEGVGGRRAEMWTVANPVVFLGGLAGMVGLGTAAWRRRSVALAVPVVAAAVQFLPWAAIGRVLFLYHYLPVVPFVAVAFGWWIALGREPRTEARRRLEIGLAAGAAVVAFVLLLPILDAWYVPDAYLNAVKGALFWISF